MIGELVDLNDITKKDEPCIPKPVWPKGREITECGRIIKKDLDLTTLKKYTSFDEMMEEYNTEQANRTVIKKIIDFLYYNIWTNIIVELFHPIYNWNRLIRLYQRVTRGWDDSDTWGLDTVISKFILPRLKRLKELQTGWPCNLPVYDGVEDADDFEKYDDIAKQQWDDILDKMILSFELVIDDNNSLITDIDFKDWKILTKKNQEHIQEGLELFAKHFQNLWW